MFEVSGQMSAENMDTDTVQFVFYTRFYYKGTMIRGHPKHLAHLSFGNFDVLDYLSRREMT